MKTLLVIPARYKSSRFPGKPLAPILGVPLIKRVWDICKAASDELGIEAVVATDDDRIKDYCTGEDIRVVMTPDTCLTGTDRIYEVQKQIEADLYMNVQGDEPVIDPADIRQVYEAAIKSPESILCGMCAISDPEDYTRLSVPKVVTAQDGRLLYMSRAGIPGNKEGDFRWSHKQVCVYSFPKQSLQTFGEYARKTPLEEQEDIEILRFLELGHEVKMVEVSGASIAVDFPEDVSRVEAFLQQR